MGVPAKVTEQQGYAPADVEREIANFVARVPELSLPKRHRYTFGELSDAKAMKREPWARSPGIYAYFTGNERLRYIGRAMLSSGLASRVSDHVQPWRRGNPKWNTVLDDGAAFGLVYAFPPEHEVWIPSIEVHLVARLHGHLVNRRRA